MKNQLKGYNEFNKINEDEEEKPFRLYGDGTTPEAELIDLLESLITDINKSNPDSQEDYDSIKENITNKKSTIVNHPSFEEFKNGFEWQDSVIKLDDWKEELRESINTLYSRASKKGLR